MATQKTTTNSQYSLKLNDLWRGLLLAVISAVLTALLPIFQSGELVFNWAAIGGVAATTAIAYLLKNFFSPSEIVLMNPTKSDIADVKEGTAEVTVTETPKK